MVADQRKRTQRGKSHLPSAGESVDYLHFRPGMDAAGNDERIAEMSRRFDAWQPVARQEDHNDDDEHHVTLAKNHRIAGVVTKNTRLPDLPKKLGTRIRLLRQRMGWSIRKLAQKSKMDHAALIRIESGQCSPTIETVTQITRALGVPLAYLVGGLEE